MAIQIKPSAIRQTRWYEYLIRFVFGGLLTAATGLITSQYGPVIGGLFLAFPSIFPASITLVQAHTRRNEKKKGQSDEESKEKARQTAAQTAEGAAIGSAGLFAFALVIYRLSTRLAPWLTLLLALAVWLGVNLLAWWLVEKMIRVVGNASRRPARSTAGILPTGGPTGENHPDVAGQAAAPAAEASQPPRPAVQPGRKLFIFDKDGTLIESFVFHGLIPHTATAPEKQELKKGVAERIEEVRQSGAAIALASNQSAVADGLISMACAEELMQDAASKIGGVAAWRCCPYKPKARKKLYGQPNPYARDDPNRKPHPGMILDLMETLGFSPDETYMVGNSDKDRQAARAAGVHFIPADKFFMK